MRQIRARKTAKLKDNLPQEIKENGGLRAWPKTKPEGYRYLST
jgi:hypothetical protein